MLFRSLLDGSGSDVKVKKCRELIADSSSFPDAVAESKLLSAKDCRMLSVGVKTGASDSVMFEIARRTDDEVQDNIDSIVGRVEPTIVIIMSVVVGLILLSVMLPLMGVMSTLG